MRRLAPLFPPLAAAGLAAAGLAAAGLAAAGLAAGCHGGHDGHDHSNLPPAPPMITPDPWSGDLAVPTLVDENPDPDVVEVTLRAAPASWDYLPGRTAQVWAYNGAIPGPTLEAKVGDRVIVHFRNDLPEATTVHWHGLRVPADMDGTTAMMEPVPPGGTFDYEFVVPDAGTFWYHPHVRSDVQVDKGLYGAILVHDPAEPDVGAAVEEVLVVDDVLVDPATGALAEGDPRRVAMMGLEGNLALVNGARSNVEVVVRAGERRRWRIVNAAASRYLVLQVAGGAMTRLGGDGGLLEAPVPGAGLLVSPGERADVVVSVGQPGATAVLRASGYERAIGVGATEPVDLVRLVAGPEPAVDPGPLPSTLRTIEPLGAPADTRTIRLSERMDGDVVEFFINGASFPDVPMIHVTAGTVERWEIVNESEMDHPFHLHGFRFQPAGAREWKDTINVPAKATVPLVVEFDDRPGVRGHWMYHCHILGHAEHGMMAEVMVQ